MNQSFSIRHVVTAIAIVLIIAAAVAWYNDVFQWRHQQMSANSIKVVTYDVPPENIMAMRDEFWKQTRGS